MPSRRALSVGALVLLALIAIVVVIAHRAPRATPLLPRALAAHRAPPANPAVLVAPSARAKGDTTDDVQTFMKVSTLPGRALKGSVSRADGFPARSANVRLLCDVTEAVRQFEATNAQSMRQPPPSHPAEKREALVDGTVTGGEGEFTLHPRPSSGDADWTGCRILAVSLAGHASQSVSLEETAPILLRLSAARAHHLQLHAAAGAPARDTNVSIIVRSDASMYLPLWESTVPYGDGLVDLPQLEEGTYAGDVKVSGYLLAHFAWPLTASSPTELDVPLLSGRVACGLVVDAKTHARVADAFLEVDQLGRDEFEADTAHATSEGRFSLGGFAEERVSLRVSAPRYQESIHRIETMPEQLGCGTGTATIPLKRQWYNGVTVTGIGLQVVPGDRELVVIRAVLSGTPAARAGLQPEDAILAVDGDDASQLSDIEVMQRIRGPVGSVVTLQVLRGMQPRTFRVERTEIPAQQQR